MILMKGYIDDCVDFPSCEAVKRAIRECAIIGEKAGFEMVKLDYDISQLFFSTVSVIASGSFLKKMLVILKGEKPIQEYKLLVLKEKIPLFLVDLIGWYKNKDPTRFRKLIKAATNDTLSHLVESLERMEKEKRKYEKLTIENRLDAWMMPGASLPATLHSQASHLLGSATFAQFFNLLRYPAGAIPVTIVREDEQYYECGFEDEMTRECKRAMENSAGLPIGVQIGCRPNRDELVLSIMKRFEPFLQKMEYPKTF